MESLLAWVFGNKYCENSKFSSFYHFLMKGTSQFNTYLDVNIAPSLSLYIYCIYTVYTVYDLNDIYLGARKDV
jgi:hypothetical protein